MVYKKFPINYGTPVSFWVHPGFGKSRDSNFRDSFAKLLRIIKQRPIQSDSVLFMIFSGSLYGCNNKKFTWDKACHIQFRAFQFDPLPQCERKQQEELAEKHGWFLARQFENEVGHAGRGRSVHSGRILANHMICREKLSFFKEVSCIYVGVSKNRGTTILETPICVSHLGLDLWHQR